MTNEIFERVPYSTEEEWLSLREKGIGGSDASAIVGQNPYKTNVELWKEKLRLNKKENTNNDFTEYGHLVENPVREIFQADYRKTLRVSHSNELLVSKQYNFMRGSLDGEIKVIEDCEIVCYYKEFHGVNNAPEPIKLKKGMRGVYEGKTTFVLSSMSKEKWSNQIPMNYYVQVLHYLLVTGYDFVVLSGMLNWEDKNGVKTHEIRNYAFLRTDVENDLDYLLEKEIKYWNDYVCTGIEPPLIINI